MEMLLEATRQIADAKGGGFSDVGPMAEAPEWRVVHTKPRQEKALAEYLERRQVEHFLPLIREARYYGKRKFRVETPLFSGYLFLRGGVEESYLVDRSERAVRVIPVSDQRTIENELASLRLAIIQNGHLSPSRLLERGTFVEVRAGPFRGVRGHVERLLRDDRLTLGVRILGRAAEMEIDGSLLEPVE